jgi:hypothetical protein
MHGMRYVRNELEYMNIIVYEYLDGEGHATAARHKESK